MKKFMRFASMLCFCGAMACTMTACSDDDPDYENVEPPVVEAAAPTLAGLITTNGGDALSGATVTLSGAGSYTATTDAKGAYSVADLKEGTYTVKAEATGVTAQEGTITVAKGEAAIWSALLPKEVIETVVVKKEEAAEMTVAVPAVAETTTAKAPEVKVEVPANTFDKDVTLTLTFNNSTAVSRATQQLALMSMTLGASDATVKFLNPINFTIPVASAPNSVTLNGTALKSSYANGNLTIEVTGLGTISLNYNITTAESSKSQALTFGQATWDNLYGTSDMNVTTASYTMQVGGTITGSNLLLNNVLALDAKVGGTQSISATYPLNVTVPVGTSLAISGSQSVKTVTYTCGSDKATATIYGDVKITTKSANRQHTGGSN